MKVSFNELDIVIERIIMDYDDIARRNVINGEVKKPDNFHCSIF